MGMEQCKSDAETSAAAENDPESEQISVEVNPENHPRCEPDSGNQSTGGDSSKETRATASCESSNYPERKTREGESGFEHKDPLKTPRKEERDPLDDESEEEKPEFAEIAARAKIAAENRRKEAKKIQAKVDAAETTDDIEDVVRLDWPREAYRITQFVTLRQMRRSRFRLFVTELNNDEDEDMFASTCFGGHEVEFFKTVTPGKARCLSSTSRYRNSARPNRPAAKRCSSNLLIGKVRKGNAARQITLLLDRMLAHVRDIISAMKRDAPNEKVETMVVRFPCSMDPVAGRKILECAFKDIGTKIELCAIAQEGRDNAPRSRLCDMTIRAGALNVFSFRKFYEELKQNIRPSAHGIEVHRVTHLESGNIRLRIKEITAGGKESYAMDVREILGCSSVFS